MKLETMKTIAFDIKDSVFDNDTEAIMYVSKDIYSDSYIISIPIITFSWDIRTENPEKDYEWLLKSKIGIGDPVRIEKFVQVIKAAISEFEYIRLTSGKCRSFTFVYINSILVFLTCRPIR